MLYTIARFPKYVGLKDLNNSTGQYRFCLKSYLYLLAIDGYIFLLNKSVLFIISKNFKIEIIYII